MLLRVSDARKGNVNELRALSHSLGGSLRSKRRVADAKGLFRIQYLRSQAEKADEIATLEAFTSSKRGRRLGSRAEDAR